MATYLDTSALNAIKVSASHTLTQGNTYTVLTTGYALVYVQGPSVSGADRLPYVAADGEVVEYNTSGQLLIGGVLVTPTTFTSSTDRVKVVAFRNVN